MGLRRSLLALIAGALGLTGAIHGSGPSQATTEPMQLAASQGSSGADDIISRRDALTEAHDTFRANRTQTTEIDAGTDDRPSEFSLLEFQSINDPFGDVGNSRADILAAAIDMDASGYTALGMTVATGMSPVSDINWWLWDTAATWEIDVHGDGVSDYFAAILSDWDGPWSGVLNQRTGELVCFGSVDWDVAAGIYVMVINTSCIGNPTQVNWRAAMLYDTVSGPYLDVAPDGNRWAGPAINSANPPAPPPAPAPAPDPDPAPAPAPGPSPNPTPPPEPSASSSRCPSPVGSPPSTASSSPVVTVNPARVFDTRTGSGPVAAGSVTQIKVAGCANVPPGSGGAVLNVTAVEAGDDGYLTVFPCGAITPNASNVNYVAGQTVPNTAVTALSSDGNVCVFSFAETHLIVDVTGFLPAASDVTTRPPVRLLDTRIDGGPRAAGSVTEIPIAGRHGAPPNPGAAVLNVTAVEAGDNGYLTVFPCGTGLPNASNVNYVAGQTVPNAVIAPVGANGSVCVYSSAPTGLIVDLSGFVPAASTYSGINPFRLLDSRIDGGSRGGGSVTEVQVRGRAGIPQDANTVVLNVTAVEAGDNGYLTVFPCGTGLPNASNVNYVAGQTVPNAVVAKIGSNGNVCVFTSAFAGLIVDAVGWSP